MLNLVPDLHYSAHGKLLLSGEYFVLDGAKALALPTRLGQSLQVYFTTNHQLEWTAYDADDEQWATATFKLPELTIVEASDEAFAERLQQILQQAQLQNPDFLTDQKGYQVTTHLEFPRQWGLGSSSTLLACLSEWAAIDAYDLLEHTFGGSGYDLACAKSSQPIIYWRNDGQPQTHISNFKPPFVDQLYFVYLGKKQNSREGISRYRERAGNWMYELAEVSTLSLNMERCQLLADFEKLLLQHEQLIARCLQLPRAQDLYFQDYWGIIKSLGAWGGDFVLATSERSAVATRQYFNELGFSVVLPFSDIIL